MAAVVTFTRRLPEGPPPAAVEVWQLALTAEERSRSRSYHQLTGEAGAAIEVRVQLPRGSVLADGDWLAAATGEVLQTIAKPEPVAIARAAEPLVLLRVAYHLGNRHVPLELHQDCSIFSRDRVLQQLAETLGATVEEAIAPFFPEIGAYHHNR